jgi:type IV pilus assembly protein PilB
MTRSTPDITTAANPLIQERLRWELLLGEPLVEPTELQAADPGLRERGTPVAAERWQELGCLPLRSGGDGLVVAVPADWQQEQRQQLARSLQAGGTQVQLRPALAGDLALALAALRSELRSAPRPEPVAAEPAPVTPAATAAPPRRLFSDTTTLVGSGESLSEVVEADEDLEQSSREASTSPVVSLVDKVLIEALTMGASDIHMEPQENGLVIRFRLDGVLRTMDRLPRTLVPAITSRLKIMADLDIAERRMPQDGRIRRIYRGRKLDVRVSTLPSNHGEKVCLRLLDSSSTQLGLNNLITDPEARQLLRAMGARPFGMILVTGPTGSGKSTTLYALLSERNDPAINISTVEDPIEYVLPGITQTQVNRDKGLDFSTALRAFMRQDPDVLLVGETRDLETAKTAIEAALTGHLVLTTLHSNDAPSALARLDEMGVEPFLVSASLIGIISQRLLRRVCAECREPYRPDAEELKHFGMVAGREQAVTFHRARHAAPGTPGCCPACQGIGYRGRVGVFEIMLMNDTLSAAVAKRASTDVLRRLALENGMTTLLGYGLELVRQGLTTLEEVERMLLTETELEAERRLRAIHTLTCGSCGAGLEDDWLECPYCLSTRG